MTSDEINERLAIGAAPGTVTGGPQDSELALAHEQPGRAGASVSPAGRKPNPQVWVRVIFPERGPAGVLYGLDKQTGTATVRIGAEKVEMPACRLQYLDNDETARREAMYWGRHSRRRRAIFRHYGRVCACCGTRENLTVDHIDGGGNAHRAEIGQGGYGFSRWLVVNGFPDGFQILCGPCNESKGDGKSCRLDHAKAAA